MLRLLAVTFLTLLLLYAGFVFLFYRALNDHSAASPLYTGPILSDVLQTPLDNEFSRSSTAMEIVKGMDLSGRTIVITGGHSGTGLEATKALASAGAHIIALSRNVDRARSRLRSVPNTEVHYVDLLEPESIDAFADEIVQSGRSIDVLINSAGIIGTPLQRDARGIERQFATNALGHYHLTVRLIPALERSGNARVVNLSSRAHKAGGVMFDDINFETTPYDGMRAYAQTKTALVLLTVKEDELLQSKGIRAFAVHPGAVPSTDIFAAGKVGYSPKSEVMRSRLVASLARWLHVTEVLNWMRRPKNDADLYKTVQQGGATTAWAAVSEDLNGRGGLYLEDSNIAPIVPNGSTAPFGVRPWALDKDAAAKLWERCAEMTGVRYEES